MSTGFARKERPGQPLDGHLTLARRGSYYFWLEIGAPVAGSIESTPHSIDIEKLPPEAELQVCLFGYDGGFSIDPKMAVGILRLAPDGGIRVQRQVEGSPPDFTDRLLFPVQAPEKDGTHRLRCSIYHKNTLLQSRCIRVEIRSTEAEFPNAQKSDVDYTIAGSLSSTHLQSVDDHTLSILMNLDAEGTHSFHFFGVKEFHERVSLPETRLATLIANVRGALRKVSWGDERQWEVTKAYRYRTIGDVGRFKQDIALLARAGYEMYFALSSAFSRGAETQKELRDALRLPGKIQIGHREGHADIVPAALFYDYRLDVVLPDSELGLCPAFEKVLKKLTKIQDCPCFKGECALFEEGGLAEKGVCPSGFWGFRHQIGLPPSLGRAQDTETVIHAEGQVRGGIAVSTDPKLRSRAEHVKRMEDEYKGKVEFKVAESREDTIGLLKSTRPHLVYFYCHGDLDEEHKIPFLKVGPPGELGLSASFIGAKNISLEDSTPLIFLNGCQTAALEPHLALDFVNAFVNVAHASGMIGTEIVVFEPLAVAVAEYCLKNWISGVGIGESLRLARLDQLKDGNPLGLVYVAYSLVGLKLEAKKG